MAAPKFTQTPNVGRVSIPTTNAIAKNDGSSTGSTAINSMVKAFTAGANGSYVDKVRFFCVSSAAATNSVATTLRVFLSTVASPGATLTTDTYLVGEIAVPIIAAAHSTNNTNYYDVILDMVIPTGTYLHVCQHVAQTANQNWNALAIGGDF